MSNFEKECPGAYSSLARMLGAGVLPVISSDYDRAVECGGNQEAALEREEGVSFNPRLARILSILLLDAGMRDVTFLRASVYSALPHGLETILPWTPEELRSVVAECRNSSSEDESACAVQAAIRLDLIRHFHMTEHSREEKAALLMTARGSNLLSQESRVPPALRQKLFHAIMLQERRLQQEWE